MEDTFTLTWEDPTSEVQNEEVICSIDNVRTLLPHEAAEYTDVCEEVVVQETQVVDNSAPQGPEPEENIMYLTEDNVLVMQQGPEHEFQVMLHLFVIYTAVDLDEVHFISVNRSGRKVFLTSQMLVIWSYKIV